MAGGFDTRTGGTGDAGQNDPGRAAREAADRIAQQVRDILQTAEQRAVAGRGRAERAAAEIREKAARAAVRLLERVDELESTVDLSLGAFFDAMRTEVRALAPLADIEAAAAESQQGEAPPEPAPAEPEGGPDETPVAPESAEGEPRPFEEPEEAEAAQAEGAEEPRRRRGRLWGRREHEPEASEAPESGQAVEEGAEDAHVM